jgi:hypothetical protein
VRDVKTLWLHGGQAVAPESSAKVYWNKAQVVYVDAGLPEPQRNGVSGLGLKLNP